MNRHASALQTERAKPIHIGDHLREWRQRRHLSQLGLAVDADISARHLSFVETGRAAPSRDMVLKLAERLNVLCVNATCFWWRRDLLPHVRSARWTIPRWPRRGRLLKPS